ncbi:1-acyl-sn-glycerol-3-phosphate acyltransferase [Sulfurimonas sp. HSL-1656]|uniref:1-acyl-sn-glycerol-3-phosphate acyltransferase n=1 Tax=Thiomicrolovo subterrani TaxID=3131934 RepID=UPI0031F9829A
MRKWLLRLLWVAAALLISLRYRVRAVGRERVPAAGAVLLLGNHVSWLDWLLVQIALRRRLLRYMMERSIYESPVLRWMFRLGRTIPVSSKASKQAFEEAAAALNAGEAVGIFPEGGISRRCEIEKFYRGFEIIASQSHQGEIVPFYIEGMCGSRLSYTRKTHAGRRWSLRRPVTVVFGAPMPLGSSADTVRGAVMQLKDTIAQ